MVHEFWLSKSDAKFFFSSDKVRFWTDYTQASLLRVLFIFFFFPNDIQEKSNQIKKQNIKLGARKRLQKKNITGLNVIYNV